MKQIDFMTMTNDAPAINNNANLDVGFPPPQDQNIDGITTATSTTTTMTSAAKRHAQRGQWQTPPLPAFFAAAAHEVVLATTGANVNPSSSSINSNVNLNAAAPPLPTSPDEYARMLQDAYKRGAEAGALASQQQQQQASLLEHKPGEAVGPVSSSILMGATMDTSRASTTITNINEANMAAMANSSSSNHYSGNAANSSDIPVSNTNYCNTNTNSTIIPSKITTKSTAATITAASESTSSNLNHHHFCDPTTNHHPSSNNTHNSIKISSSSLLSPSNSFIVPQCKSMPDMSSYHNNDNNNSMTIPSNNNNNNNNDEEYKRKKRLARNRASARLRRLKKKNLVDSYEGEVGILEAALGKLKMHHWGATVPSSSSSSLPDCNDYTTNENPQQQQQQPYEGLIEALSMERGQAPLTPEARRQLIQSIISQQKEQVGNLLEVQLENWILCASILGGSGAATSTGGNTIVDKEMTRVATELQSLLHLTPQQVSLMEQQYYSSSSSSSVMNEIQDLFSVMDCLESINSNMWLLDEGVEDLSSQLTSILNPTQLSKLLLWSDHNAEAIEKLDFMNVLPAVGGGGGEEIGGGPVFEFGVDEGLPEGD